MKNKTFISSFVTAIILIVLCSCANNRGNNTSNVKSRVNTFAIQADSALHSVSFPGRVKASNEVDLSFKVSGRIKNVYVKEGLHVKKGQLLAEIDNSDYMIQKEAAEAQFNQISSEANRIIKLYKEGVVSENDYDKARFGLQQIQAKLDYTTTQVSDCKLFSPIEGVVQRRFFDPAAVIGAGMPVLSLVGVSMPEIEIEIPSVMYLARHRFKSIYAEFNHHEFGKMELKIMSINPKANANQLYTVRLAIVSKCDVMPSPGMNTMVNILFEGDGYNETIIPANSIFCANENGDSNVWVISSDGVVHAKKVTVIRFKANGMAIVKENFPIGTKIVSSGVHKLSEGQEVTEIEAPSKTNIGGIL